MQIFKIDTDKGGLFEYWHPYWLWEEVAHNMWGEVDNRNDWLKKAIAFTGDHDLYGQWMMNVANEWIHSCQHNLTKSGSKKAWIGHAAVAMAIQCPEDIVREAWGYLSKDQQDSANAKAQYAIDYWRARNA